jgi:hypothetical protein
VRKKGAISVLRQFTHGAWSDLKTANSRRRISLARDLVRQLRLHRLRTPRELVFPGPSGQPVDYHAGARGYGLRCSSGRESAGRTIC